MVNSEPRCIESVRHSKVKVHDRGTNVSAIFLNGDQQIVERIRMDGCLMPPQRAAADFLVSLPAVIDVIVELKGSDLRKAFEQVESTIDFLQQRKKRSEKPPNSQAISVLIICSEVPSKNARIQRKRDVLARRGFRVVISKHNAGEFNFSTFLGAPA